MDKTKTEIREFLTNYIQNVDGIWAVKATPGYARQLDGETSKILRFLESLLDG